MAIEFEDNVNIEEEIKALETHKEEEEFKKNKIKNENVDLTEIKIYINLLHKSILNKTFKLNFSDEIINELDKNFIHIIEARVPNLAFLLEKIGPEMAYAGTFFLGLAMSHQEQKKTNNFDVLSIPEVKKPNE